jgi:hypothetical protein
MYYYSILHDFKNVQIDGGKRLLFHQFSLQEKADFTTMQFQMNDNVFSENKLFTD